MRMPTRAMPQLVDHLPSICFLQELDEMLLGEYQLSGSNEEGSTPCLHPWGLSMDDIMVRVPASSSRTRDRGMLPAGLDVAGDSVKKHR